MLLFVVISGLSWPAAGATAARTEKKNRSASLRGLAGMAVVVEMAGSNVQEYGLTGAYLQTKVETRLRKAGIPVLSPAERSRTAGKPYLYLNVRTFPVSPNNRPGQPLGFAFSYGVELREQSLLARTKQEAFSPVWSLAGLGYTNTRYTKSFIAEEVIEPIDEFIKDYLTANPSLLQVPATQPTRYPDVRCQDTLHCRGR